MSRTKIQWSEFSWNPVVGCTKVSAGCQNCYAERMAVRLACMKKHVSDKYSVVISAKAGWSGRVFCDESALEIPLHWKKPRMIFVVSMGDLFLAPFEFIDKVMATIALCVSVTRPPESYRHIFQVLTKREQIMLAYFADPETRHRIHIQALSIVHQSQQKNGKSLNMWDGRWPLSNLWLGVTAENQEMADKRIPILLQIPAKIRFLSIEPLLSPVDLLKYLKTEQGELYYDKKSRNNVFGLDEDRNVQDGLRRPDMENGQNGRGEPEGSGVSETLPKKTGRKKQVGLQNGTVYSKSEEVQSLCSSDSLDGSLSNSDTSRARNQSQRRKQGQQPSCKSGDINSAGECNSQFQGTGKKTKRPKRRKKCNSETDKSASAGNTRNVQSGRTSTNRDSITFPDNTECGQCNTQKEKLGTSPISWVIVGGESGPKRRECKIPWMLDIVRQCRDAGVKCFVKQVSINGKVSHDPAEWPVELRVQQLPQAQEAK